MGQRSVGRKGFPFIDGFEMRLTLSFSLPAPSARDRRDKEWLEGSPVSAPRPLSSRDLIKIIPNRAERFPVVIAAIAQPPIRHQRIHTDKEHPPHTSTSLQLKALDLSPGVPVHFPVAAGPGCGVGTAGQCLGAHLLPGGVSQGAPVPGSGCPVTRFSLGLCLGGWRNLCCAGESPHYIRNPGGG